MHTVVQLVGRGGDGYVGDDCATAAQAIINIDTATISFFILILSLIVVLSL